MEKAGSNNKLPILIRVYGQFCIETLHERHNGIQRLVVCSPNVVQAMTEGSTELRSVLLIRIGKQNVEILDK